jgi:hypothetical protein
LGKSGKNWERAKRRWSDRSFAHNYRANFSSTQSVGRPQIYVMKTRSALFVASLLLSASFVHAADVAIDGLIAQIKAKPAEAPALIAQAVAKNPASASALFKAAFEAAPAQIMAALKTAIAQSPELAPSAVEQAMAKLSAGLAKPEAAKIASSLTAAAIAALPAQMPADQKKQLVGAIAASVARTLPVVKAEVALAARSAAPEAGDDIERALNAKTAFPQQRPAIVVSPSR